MEFLINAMGKLPAINQTVNSLLTKSGSPALIKGLPDSARAVFSAYINKTLNKKIFLVTESEAVCHKMAEDIISLGLKPIIFPARDYNFLQTVGFSREYEHKRIDALWKIAVGDFDIALVDIESLTSKCPSKSAIKNSVITLDRGDEIDLKAFTERLVMLGYEKTEQVDGMGQFGVRGGIIDLFSPGNPSPVRIELWGDEIDSIAYFDVTDQRRGEEIESVAILPATEFTEETDTLVDILEKISLSRSKKSENFLATLNRDLDILKSGGSFSLDRYMNCITEKAAFVFDYMTEGVLVFAETRNVFARLKSLESARLNMAEDLFSAGVTDKSTGEFYLSKDGVAKNIEALPTVYTDNFASGGYPLSPKATGSVFLRQLSPWSGSMDVLLEDLRPAVKRKKTVAILAGSEKGAKILVSQLENNGIAAQYTLTDDIIAGAGVFVMPGSFSAGLEFTESGELLISHKSLNLKKRKNKKPAKDKGEAFNSLEELKVGDYVVHFAHGIGQFDGIHRIETGNVVKDYIKIKYKGTDVLYLPVTQLDLVSRYIGVSGENGPPLHRLGGTEWQRARTRVKAAVKDIAKELTRLYGERMKSKGFAFSSDGELQRDFEAKFPYEETEDQLRAIDEIKGDMEREVPMDRLLCGDVGFGKTEVALRAAFKCVCDGKQCAILVPTTILAWQHFLTATERFGDIPVKIEMLSRFRTKSQIDKTLKALKNGDVDLVIGTHRMISADVKFRDLGLVIIDEEQRFGVAQKEKLKTAFKSVDVLTLTATPIPRTLNMAMSGIRDMSSIEEAPLDRQPVQTYVLEQNNGVLVEAMRKEIRRGGQVYYMHNRVESINHCAARISAAIPEAKIGVAHGKMGEEELSEIWRSLLEGEIDILVCTTIIETGVDVPNANTLIIEDADKMGLAQLHQIRGRVGRSNRRAYAYFCFRRGKALSEIATKRLEAIREYTEFGSGFKIAMRDLEIRGAGNILGGEQHGHMEAVGYDMYIRLLNEAIGEEKGQEPEKATECSVDLDISANIPERYIPSLSARLSMYRRIADIKTVEDKFDVIDELCDRFGEPPAEVLGLVDIALLKGGAGRCGISEISGDSSEIRFFVDDFKPEVAGEILKKLGNTARLIPADRVHFSIKLKPGQSPINLLRDLAEKF